jgi:hypothetical protein
MSQKDQILKHLKKNRKGLTALEALGMYGVFRLATRIFELKNDDKHNIKTILKQDENGKMYARYVLEEGTYDKPKAVYTPRGNQSWISPRHSATH